MPTPSALRRLIDHNPFLLVSAVLALAGGYLVAAGEGGTLRLIGLFGFIQLYELALLGSAGFIERWVGPRDPSARRDAATLLILEALFLGDLSFTNSVFPGARTTGFELGVDREDLVAPVLAAALAIGLGPVKLWLAGRAGRIEWPRALYGYVLFALALIHGGPVLVLLLGEASNATGAVNTLWWVAAFLPLLLTRAVAAGEGRMGPFEHLDVPGLGIVLRVSRPTGVLVLGGALLASAIGHVVSASWAHLVEFKPWQPSALLIGLAAAWPRLVPARACAASTAGLSLGAALGAVVLAAFADRRDTIFLGPWETTPFRAVGLLAVLALADAARKTGRPRLVYAAAGIAVTISLGGTPHEVDAALLVPGAGTKWIVGLAALAATVVRVGHLHAAGVGLVASFVLSGEVKDGWLLASLVCLHQLVLAHRHRSAPWMKLRTLLAWAALLTSLGALGPRVAPVDLYVLSLVAAALVAWRRGIGCGYQWPAGLVLLVHVGDRVARNAPRERAGVGVLALAAGVVFLAAGLAYSIYRQRLADWAERRAAQL